MAKAKSEAATEAASSNDSSAPTEETSSALVPKVELPVVETVSAVPPDAPKVEPEAPQASPIANPIAPPPVVSAPITPKSAKEPRMPSDKSTSSRSARGPRAKVHEHGDITWDGVVYRAGKTYVIDTEKHNKEDYESLLESGALTDLDKLEADEVLSEPDPVL